MIPDDLSDLFCPAVARSDSAEELLLIAVGIPLLILLIPVGWLVVDVVVSFVFGKNR
jgi:hypothetical protein